MTFAWNLNNMALRVMYFREDPWLLNDLTTALSNAKVQKSTVMRDVCRNHVRASACLRV
jgi:hypothetical protein